MSDAIKDAAADGSLAEGDPGELCKCQRGLRTQTGHDHSTETESNVSRGVEGEWALGGSLSFRYESMLIW